MSAPIESREMMRDLCIKTGGEVVAGNVQPKLRLEALALEMPVMRRHPNRAPFRGVLTRVDEVSDRPPSGAQGHRVVMTRKAAEEALPSLLGMGIGSTPQFNGHDARKKIGVITAAQIVEHDLMVEGHIFAKDFPEIVTELKKKNGMGMSYEVSDALVANVNASVWTLTGVTFTGAAVLRQEKAAYGKTRIALKEESNNMKAAARPQLRWSQPATERRAKSRGAKKMEINEQSQQSMFQAEAERMGRAAEALESALASLGKLEAEHHELKARVERIVAAVEEHDVQDQRRLELKMVELQKENMELKTQVGRLSAGAQRKTLSPMVSALLAKSGFDGQGQDKLETPVLDKTLASLPVEQRIAVKAQMAQAGIID